VIKLEHSSNKIVSAQLEIPAGEFSAWLRQIRNSLPGENGIDVACGECIGCCSSSYFIHVNPGESEALSRIPKEVLFPAPRLPKGHLLMGYDKAGICPMLKQGKCIVYEHRPETCRSYDCRVFAAAGIAAGGDDKAVINRRVERWRFSYPTQIDQDEHLAVRAAATFIREHASCFPDGRVPDNPSQLAMLAIKSYSVFIRKTPANNPDGARSDAETASEIVKACKQFDRASESNENA
jgi:Fe-S-cluster containining protein